MDYIYLEPDEQQLVEAGQDREKIANLTVRALKAELANAEIVLAAQQHESQAIMLRVRAAHGIEPQESAFLEKVENGRIRWVVSRTEIAKESA